MQLNLGILFYSVAIDVHIFFINPKLSCYSIFVLVLLYVKCFKDHLDIFISILLWQLKRLSHDS